MLRCIAHNDLELHERRSNHYVAFKRVLDYHGIDMSFATSTNASQPTLDFASMPDVDVAEDQAFGALKDEYEKTLMALEEIHERGEDAFRNQCFGYATPEAINAGRLTSFQQKLVDVYFKTIHLDRVPALQSDEELREQDGQAPDEPVGPQPAVEALLEMDKPGVMDGLNLNATMRCLTGKEQLRIDDAMRGCKGRKTDHWLLKTGLGTRMTLVGKIEKLLGVEGLVDGGELPQDILDIANRAKLGKSTFADRSTVGQLIALTKDIFKGESTKSENIALVFKNLAAGCGLTFESEQGKEPREDARDEGRPSRKEIYTYMGFERRLPEIVDDWMVWSPRLCSNVRVEDWEQMHHSVNADEMQAGLMGDVDIAPSLAAFVPSVANGGSVLVEKINGPALAAELARLRAVPESRFTVETALLNHRRLTGFLEALDEAAQPADADGVRLNFVSYGKNMTIGRRTASYPSMQQCPSSLRPLLVGKFGNGGGEHDIDMVNCHPTLMLTVATGMPGTTLADVPTLAEIVNDREPLLDRIAVHYGTSRGNAKTCILRIMNGGTVEKWVEDADCQLNRNSIQRDLRNLMDEMAN
eukprot:7391841-Prymnesium_polylepis.1